MSLSTDSIFEHKTIDFKTIFTAENLGHILGNRPQISFKKGAYIYLPDESAQNIYFLTEGKVKIGTYGVAGKEITKNVFDEGEFFGESILFGTDAKRRDYALATENSKAFVISKGGLQVLFQKIPHLTSYMLNTIGERKLEMEQRIESLYFKDSRSRIIEFLYNLGNKKGERIGYEVVIRKSMTHQEIANLTATSRQTVTTVLNELRSRNLITFNRRRFLIRNMETLSVEGLVAV